MSDRLPVPVRPTVAGLVPDDDRAAVVAVDRRRPAVPVSAPTTGVIVPAANLVVHPVGLRRDHLSVGLACLLLVSTFAVALVAIVAIVEVSS